MQKEKPTILFCGSSSDEVTGSAYLVKYIDKEILVDYGLRQSSDQEEDYRINSKRNKDIKPKKLDLVVLTHCHADHAGLVPRLYKDGCKAEIIVQKGSKPLLELMWRDSAKINKIEHEKLGHLIIYDEKDVDEALAHIKEIDIHEKYEAIKEPNISVTLYSAQHIVKASQVLLSFGKTKKIGFTGDISDYRNKYWLTSMDYLPSVDVLVGEATYGNTNRNQKEKDRKTDISKLKTAIDYALNKKAKIVIPTFSLNRIQDLMATIYEMYDGKPPIKIYVDSPLGMSISKLWPDLIDKDHELWDNICSSGAFKWVQNYLESKTLMETRDSMLVLAGGGMLQGGRAKAWFEHTVYNKHNHIIFSGYAVPGTLAGQLKQGLVTSIRIGREKVKCRAKVLSLNSFSSHCDNKLLLDYYSTVKYNKICLVHADKEVKLNFAGLLKERLSKENRTSKVIVVNKGTKINV